MTTTLETSYQQKIFDCEYLEAAHIAIQLAERSADKTGAWKWAEKAMYAASLENITLEFSHYHWPDIAGAKAQLEKAMKGTA